MRSTRWSRHRTIRQRGEASPAPAEELQDELRNQNPLPPSRHVPRTSTARPAGTSGASRTTVTTPQPEDRSKGAEPVRGVARNRPVTTDDAPWDGGAHPAAAWPLRAETRPAPTATSRNHGTTRPPDTPMGQRNR